MLIDLPSKARFFTDHGVVFTGETETQWFGTCPFTDRESKFYVNKATLLWDSKTAGLSGNPPQFLHHIAARNIKRMTRPILDALATDRRLPIEAFLKWGVGHDGTHYTIPIRAPRGTVMDLRRYKIGGRMLATTGATTGLLGANELPLHPTEEVFVCEGEWDTIALDWLRTEAEMPGVVVGVPGANTFKPEWAMWLNGRTVTTLYDHDQAGIDGEQHAYKRLHACTQRLWFVHWFPDAPSGFDTRDFITAERPAVEAGDGREIWDALMALRQDEPRVKPAVKEKPSAASREGPSVPASAWVRPSLDDVIGVFKKWLYLNNTHAISIMLATAVSQSIDGEPIWMFLVGSPGSAKTETLNSLSTVPNVYMTSSLTPHSLISGANWKDGADPSLIPRLDGKVMIIKDFTSILSLRDTEKDEIFGILRDAYDGRCGKEFGNGVVRNYVSRFTMLAAVTPSIYSLSSQHTALGERFLKFAMGDNLVHDHEDDIIARAIDNIDVEQRMRSELADVVCAYLTQTIEADATKKGKLPIITPAMKTKIIALARFGARIRGTVTRDMYRNDIVTSRPSAEVGSRLGKQLAKLAQSLAIVHGQKEVTNVEYQLVKKTMLDTLPQRTEDMLRSLLAGCPRYEDRMSMQDLSHLTRYPVATCSRLLQDLNVLNVVERIQLNKGRSVWTVSHYIRDLITKCEMYQHARPVVRARVKR